MMGEENWWEIEYRVQIGGKLCVGSTNSLIYDLLLRSCQIEINRVPKTKDLRFKYFLVNIGKKCIIYNV